MVEEFPALFKGLPEIPVGLSDVMRYKFEMNQYKQKIKGTAWIFIQILASILILGIIWINILWVKAIITTIANLIFYNKVTYTL